MRGLRLPHARAIAAEVLATARSQRWDPTEVVKALLAEEVAGRARSMLASRRKAAGFPTGKIFAAWDPDACSIPAPTFATHTNSTALSRDEIFRDRCPYAQESPGIRSASRSRPCPHRLTRSPSSMGRP